MDINELNGNKWMDKSPTENELNKNAIEKRVKEVKKDVEANEEKDKERERLRVREVKLQKKIKDKAQNIIEEAPMVLLGSEEEEMEEE